MAQIRQRSRDMATIRQILFKGPMTERPVVCEGQVVDIGFTNPGVILTIAEAGAQAYDVELTGQEIETLIRRATAEPI